MISNQIVYHNNVYLHNIIIGIAQLNGFQNVWILSAVLKVCEMTLLFVDGNFSFCLYPIIRRIKSFKVLNKRQAFNMTSNIISSG